MHMERKVKTWGQHLAAAGPVGLELTRCRQPGREYCGGDHRFTGNGCRVLLEDSNVEDEWSSPPLQIVPIFDRQVHLELI